jgi:hypothetical protein
MQEIAAVTVLPELNKAAELEWSRADSAARSASAALDKKMALHARGEGPAPSFEEHERAFQLCAIAARAALVLIASRGNDRPHAFGTGCLSLWS